jgi:hypothetical protein
MSGIIIKQNEVRGDITQKGLKMGLDPQISEMVGELYRNDTTGIIAPRHLTERRKKIAETGIKNDFVFIIMEDIEHNFKGFATRTYNKTVFEIETETWDTHNECGKDLMYRIDRISKSLKYIN